MKPNNQQALESLFQTALEKHPAACKALLAEFCNDDASLLVRLQELISEQANTDPSPATGNDWSEFEEQLSIGDKLGPYEIQSQIGEGGMGLVFKAEQQQPIRRIVALKIIKAGMSSRQVLRRFQMEQQTLAAMNHPYIAQVHDAGVTADKRPYFVMEYIKGKPLAEFCDDRQLDLTERLELFGRVCDGVRYAHQRGIVHRDLKPANILVMEAEGKFVPKIIDFGIAKALDASQEPGLTQLTAVGTTMGSPGYMSPEQASTNEHEIDTRTDVYALGVILYELMTGFLPISPEQWRLKSLEEMLDVVLHKPAPKPSELLKASREQLSDILPNRKTSFHRLHSALKGDLDWIILKALEKDKNRRYSTAAEFQNDIENYLKGMPVNAGPPGISYHLRKLVQRHKLPVIAFSLLFISMIVGIVGTTRGFILAKGETKNTEQTLELLADFLTSAKPEAEGVDLKVVDLLDGFAKKLDEDTDVKPENLAYLYRVLGSTYKSLGAYKKSEAYFNKSLDIIKKNQLEDTKHYWQTLEEMGWLNNLLDQPEEALALFDQVLEVYSNSDNPRPTSILKMNINRATALRNLHRYDEAEETYSMILSPERNLRKLDEKAYYNAKYNLASVLNVKRQFERSNEIFKEVHDFYSENYGKESTKVIDTLQSLANNYFALLQYDQALELEEKALKFAKKLYGPSHPRTIKLLGNYAITNFRGGDKTLALKLLEEVWQAKSEIYGETHRQSLDALKNLIRSNMELGHYEQSLLLQTTFATLEKEGGYPASDVLSIDAKRIKAQALYGLKKYDDAFQILHPLLSFARETLGEKHGLTFATQKNLAYLYLIMGQTEYYLSLMYDYFEKARIQFGPDNPLTLNNVKRALINLMDHNENKAANTFKNHLELVYSKEYGRDSSIFQNLQSTLSAVSTEN